MLDQDYQALNNMLLRVKQLIYYVKFFDNYSIMSYNTTINSAEKNMKKIHLSATIFNEFTSIYYDDRYDLFEMPIKKFTASSDNNSYRPDVIY